MKLGRAAALAAGFTLAMSLALGGVDAQTESATAEDGKSIEDAPAEAVTAPNVPIGANLPPTLGALPQGPPILTPAGTGQSGTSSVSMTPGTLTSGVAREGANAERVPEAPREAAPAAAPAAAACTDFPTWYDAQLALESSVDTAVINALDPDGDAIACEDVMYP